jgi:hypothetical protein
MGSLRSMRTLLAFVCLVSFVVHVAAQSVCGGNCPQGNCPNCVCGTKPNYLTQGYINSILSNAGFYDYDELSNMSCIINIESGGDASALNYQGDGSYFVGLFQISDNYLYFCNLDSSTDLCDPQTNAYCAFSLWSSYGYNPWAGDSAACGFYGYAYDRDKANDNKQATTEEKQVDPEAGMTSS